MAHTALALTASAIFGVMLFLAGRKLDRRGVGLLLLVFGALTIFLLLTRAGR
jgi:hypothetical protein